MEVQENPKLFTNFAAMKSKKLIIACIMLLATATMAHAQGITMQDGSVDVGAVVFGKPTTALFTLTNDMPRTVTINAMRTSCGCTAADYPTGAIASGSSFAVALTYDAATLGHFTKSAQVFIDGVEEPIDLTMTGLIVEDLLDYSDSYPYTIGTLLTDADEVVFDDVNRGDYPTQVIHVMNTGSKTYTPHLLHLPDYLTAVVSPEHIAPKRSGRIELTLNSDALRDFGLTHTNIYLAGEIGESVSSENMLPVSVVLLPDFDEVAGGAQVPQIALSEESLTMDFDTKDKASAIITITNNGQGILEISRLQLWGDGLMITLGSKEIAPGTTTRLKVTAQRSKMTGSRAPRILMITNDPQRPKIAIDVNTKE